MGHRRRSTIYKLTFDDTHGEELAGLEIRCRGASHDQLFDIALLGGVDFHNLMETGIDSLRRISASFPERMLDWNHEDEDGRPIPCTKEAFLDEDYTFTVPIVQAWVNTIRADPKTGATIALRHEPEPATIPADDLSDLPMTISDDRLYAESEL
jgi:hypothetical protein